MLAVIFIASFTFILWKIVFATSRLHAKIYPDAYELVQAQQPGVDLPPIYQSNNNRSVCRFFGGGIVRGEYEECDEHYPRPFNFEIDEY